MKNKMIAIVISVIVILSIISIIAINFMRKGEVVTGKNIEWLKHANIAHRGLHTDTIPENSMSAFENAIKNNRPIELDVHITTDGEVVVFHDNNLKRITNVDKDIEKCSYGELRDLKLLGTNEGIPLFREVLKLVNGKVPLLIEIKNEGKVGAVEKATTELLKDYKGEFAVQAFNPLVLAWFKENAPEIVRGQLSGSYSDSKHIPAYQRFVLKNLLLNFKSKPAFIAYEIDSLPKGFIESQRKEGIVVLGWTARSIKEYEKALDYCDGIIFEDINPDQGNK